MLRDLGSIRVQIATIARRQHGHITREQLLGLGVSARTIASWVQAGKLVRVHAGVYAVGYRRPEPVARAAAAVLACGPAALLSHESAAALWGLTRAWPDLPHVTSPADRTRRGIVTHRCRTLTRADARLQLGIRVTSPARTILDIAPGFTDVELQRAYDDGRLKCELRPEQLQELLDRVPTHKAVARARALIQDGQAPTRSEFEDAFRRFTAQHGLPTPRINARVAGFEVDALFEAERVIVELDGFDAHQGRKSFEADRERDATALAQGIVTVRITWERLIRRDAREARRLKAILDERRGPESKAA